MLSAFPYLLSYERLAPLLIRVALGAVFMFSAYKTFTDKTASANRKIVGIIEGVSGILMVIGLWTQIAALVAAVDLLIRLVSKITKRAFLTDGINYYLLLLVMALCLLVTGAGFLAFDLPL